MRRAAPRRSAATALALPVGERLGRGHRPEGHRPEEEGRRRDQDLHGRRRLAGRWGDVQVTIVVKKTTTTNPARRRRPSRGRSPR